MLLQRFIGPGRTPSSESKSLPSCGKDLYHMHCSSRSGQRELFGDGKGQGSEKDAVICEDVVVVLLGCVK